MWQYEIVEMIVGIVGAIGIIIPSVGIPLYFSYKKKKLQEEHRTNNLAIAYQILSQRPEVTMDEVKKLMVLSAADPTEVMRGNCNEYLGEYK